MTELTGNWLRPPAAARYLGISSSTLAKWRLRGFGPKWAKLSKAVVYDRATLEDFARSNLRSSTSEVAPEAGPRSLSPCRRGRSKRGPTYPCGDAP
jgi:hypothetical protein